MSGLSAGRRGLCRRGGAAAGGEVTGEREGADAEAEAEADVGGACMVK